MELRNLKYWALIIGWLTSFIVFSQTSTIKQPYLKNISTATGLSQNTVNAFYEDSDGFVWIATDSGINRFDGQEMLSAEAIHRNLLGQSVKSIEKDQQNNLWLSTKQGLTKISTNFIYDNITGFPLANSHSTPNITVLGSESYKDNQRLVFTSHGVYFYTDTQRDLNQPASMQIFHSANNRLLSYTKDGDHYWLGAAEGLYLFNPQSKQVNAFSATKLPKKISILSLALITSDEKQPQSKKQLFIGSELGLYRLTSSTQKKNTLIQLTDKKISAITLNHNAIYISSKNILYHVDKQSGNLTKLFSLKEVLADYSNYIISSLFIDSRELLWIGTRSQGVYLWNSQQKIFPSWYNGEDNSQQPINNNLIWSILPDDEKGFWLAGSSGLDYLNISTNQITTLIGAKKQPTETPKLKIYDVIKVATSLWLGSNNGLLEYHPGNARLTTYSSNLIENKSPFTIYSLVASDLRTLWLATNIGVVKFDIFSKKFSYEKHIMSKNNAVPVRYITFKKGKLWIALTDKLISYQITERKTKTVFNFNSKVNGQSDALTDLLFIDDRLWLSFNGDGVYAINLISQEVQHFHTVTGFPDNFIFSLIYSQQHIWATSTQGLVAIDPKNSTYKLLTHKDGLLSNEFNEGAAIVTVQGDLLLASSKGLSLISAEQLVRQKKLTAPIISLARTINDTKNINHLMMRKQTVLLIDDSDTLELHLTTLDYINRRRIEYQYWLDKPSSNSMKQTFSSKIVLANLAVGTHYVNLQYRPLGDKKFSPVRSLEIKVTSSKWFVIPQSIGNYMLLSLIFIFLAYFRYRSYKKSKKLYDEIASNEKRLELALLDENRGVWDCLINHKNYENSIFIIYQHNHDPIELTLKQYFKLIHPDDAEKATSVWKNFARGKQTSYFETYRNYFNQHWVWNRIYGKINAYDKNGKPKRATGIWADITQEKKLEDKLNLFSHAFQSTQDIVVILDNDFVIKVVNNAYEKITGFLANNLVGNNMLDLAATRFTKEQTEKIQHIVNENKHWQGESSVARKNAPSFPVDIRVNIITQNGRDLGYVLVMRDISQIKQSKTLPIKSSFYDQVTGLPNKAIAFDRLRQLIKRCVNDDQELSIVFLNIEQFDSLVKQYSQDTLNTLLIKICERLIPYIGKHDVFAKYEQDTFIIILINKKQDNSSLFTVNQLLREVSKPFSIDSNQINITSSAGISRYPEDSNSWSELVTKAETALAQTKKQGANIFKYYHADSNKEATERVRLENKLIKALTQEELFLVYQPLFKLDSMKNIEFDINLRWKLDNEHIIYPSQFIPIAEKLGLIDDFSNWIVNNALRTLRHWNEEGLKIYINLNLHVKYLLNPQSIQTIKEQLENYSIDPNYVFIAIHEDDIISNIDKLSYITERLSEIGVRLVLDDFGKSSASIQNIQKLKFHSVKFDRTLIRNINARYFNNRVLQGIISLLNDLDIGSVAKGIETSEQLLFLQQNKCRYGQGFLFSDPLNENQARLYLLNSQ